MYAGNALAELHVSGFLCTINLGKSVLLIGAVGFLISPYLLQSWFVTITSFINGILFCILIYVVLFMEFNQFFGFILIFAGIGLVLFMPHFFMFQLIRNYLIKPFNTKQRNVFLTAVGVCVVTIIYSGLTYRKAMRDMDDFKSSGYTSLNKTFMTEKILGMHFIYHTRICIYDGWRPPIHEPFLILGMWLNGRKDPLDLDLKTRLNLYKKFFPGNQYKFECSCALEESTTYHRDELWR
ncbi:MAG TPA: hypothetical protein VGF79_08275 [Bacteroidia bacterium]